MNNPTITIIIEPVAARPGYFNARFGERVLCSREPFFASARALLASGSTAEQSIHMKHAGSDIIAMSATVGAAARLTIYEDAYEGPRLRLFKPRHNGPRRREGSAIIPQSHEDAHAEGGCP